MDAFDTLQSQSELIKRAYAIAKKAHQHQRRKTGEPYFFHPLAAARTVAQWGADEATVAATLLHDVIEDTPYTIEELKKECGAEVAFLVEGVTKITQISYSGLERDLENLRKFILHLSKDVRVILVRLADRYHNLKTLYAMTPEKQKSIALETMEIFAPLAYRLDMYAVAGELEDLAFPYIYPQEYKWLIQNVKDLYEARVRYAERFHPILKKTLAKNGIYPVHIVFRAKRYTSLYRKLLRYDMNIDHINDLVAMRIIVKTKEECYECLRVLHLEWSAAQEGFDDYIAHPKPNGYQSLHTNIYGPGKKILEVQIRTEQMHEHAEHGFAARFAYERLKESPAYALGGTAIAGKDTSWIAKLRLWKKDPKRAKVTIFENTILVMSPKRDIVELPIGSTVLDFAYKIHGEVGNHFAGAMKNGRQATIDTPLDFGDVIEITTLKDMYPRPEWLKAAKTHYAQTKIKAALEHRLQQEEAKQAAKQGEIRCVIERTDHPPLSAFETTLHNLPFRLEHIEVQSVKGFFRAPQTVISLIGSVIEKRDALAIRAALKSIKGVHSVLLRTRMAIKPAEEFI